MFSLHIWNKGLYTSSLVSSNSKEWGALETQDYTTILLQLIVSFKCVWKTKYVSVFLNLLSRNNREIIGECHFTAVPYNSELQ